MLGEKQGTEKEYWALPSGLLRGEMPTARGLSWEVAGRAWQAEGARCAKARSEKGLGAPVSAGRGVRGLVHGARPECLVAGIVLYLRGRLLEDSSTGEPASDPSLVKIGCV